MDLKYVFEDMFDGTFQVRLCGEFVCYSTHTNEERIDEHLKQHGFKTKQDYLSYRLKQYQK